jgi:predicted ATPase
MVTRGVEGVETHMVGREGELKTLQELIETVIRNHMGRFVTVVGEAGLGKSRLLYEFELWLYRQPMSFMHFKSRATLDTLRLPYRLLRDLIASRFGILDDDPLPVVRDKVVDGFRQALGEVEHLEMKAHFVGQLLGYDFRDSPYLQGVLDAPRQLHGRAFVYLSDYFKALALDHPVIIFLDDIHWADESSLDMLFRLGNQLSNQQVLFIALSRPALFERRPSWGNEAFHQRLALQPLSQHDSQHLVREVLQKVQDVPEVLSDLIISNAEGNPYYLEELIRMLVEDGVIVKDEPAWRIHVDRLDEVRVPPTLTGVVQARLEGLPKEERTVLQAASVVGRVFWDAAVLYMIENSTSDQVSSETKRSDIVQNLDSLQSREMVFQREDSAFSDAAEYSFKHTILREVTYESVLKRTRRAYHAMVADWLIALGGERAAEVTGLIAGHLEKAGKIDEALDYLCQAADAAASKYAINEAAEFYARALVLTPEDDLERRYTLLLGSERVFAMQGDRDAQREMLDSLNLIVDRLEDERKWVEVLIRRAWYAYFQGEYQETLIAARRAVDMAEVAREQDLAGKAYYAWAWGYLQQGDPDNALVYAKDALNLARQAGDRRDEGNILNILGMISIARGDYSTAREHLEEFLIISQEIGDQERQITALNNLGVVHTSLGSYQAAQEYYQQVLSIVREMGDRMAESTSIINLAWVMSAQGEWESAIQFAERGIAMKKQFEQMEAMAEGLTWLGHARQGLGQPEAAMLAYQAALEIREELDQPHFVMEASAGIARAAMAQGDLSTALDQIERIIAYLSTGETLLATWEPLRIYLTCYRGFQSVKDQRAGEILEQAYNLLQDRANRILDEQDRQQYLEDVPWHHEIVSEWQASRTLE